MRDLIHQYDKVVFGSNMCALLYAYINQIPLFYCGLNKPRYFEYFDASFSFGNIKDKNSIIINNEIVEVGMRKIDLWHSLSLAHSIAGDNQLPDGCLSARIDEDMLKLTTKNSRVIKLKFNHMYMFEENIEGLPNIKHITTAGMIYDYFHFLTLHDYKKMLIETEQDFVNQVWIKDKNGIVVTKTQNIYEDIPDYMIRFRVLELAKQYGYKGKQNGIYHYRKELKIPRFKKLDLRFEKRIIEKTVMNEYHSQENLTFIEPSDMLEAQLLKQLQTNRLWNRLRS
jgi:hypothetical protein